MLAGIVAVVIVALNNHGGFYTAMTELSQYKGESGALKEMNGAYASLLGPDPLGLFGVIVLTSLGTWGLPQMVHKFYTIKDERSIKTGTIISTIFAIVVSGGCYFLGGFGRVFTGNVLPTADGKADFDAIIPNLVTSFPDILSGIVLVLVLSASMSTLASLVITSSSTLTLDLIAPLLKGKDKDAKDKKQLLIMRVLIAAFLALSVIIALNKNNLISDLMGYSWGALAGAFLAPFLYGLYLKRASKIAVWVSLLSATAITVLHYTLVYLPKVNFTFFGMNFASPVNLGAVLMLGNLILFPIVSAITPKMKKEDVDEAFSCYYE
jgi:SSS family solute:Na+ symporter